MQNWMFSTVRSFAVEPSHPLSKWLCRLWFHLQLVADEAATQEHKWEAGQQSWAHPTCPKSLTAQWLLASHSSSPWGSEGGMRAPLLSLLGSFTGTMLTKWFSVAPSSQELGADPCQALSELCLACLQLCFTWFSCSCNFCNWASAYG